MVNNKFKMIKVSEGNNLPLISFKCDIATPTVVIKKSILRGKYFNTKIKYGEDILFWSELSKITNLKAINIPTAIININQKTSSNNLSIQKIGFENINKYSFPEKSIMKLIHKIYFKFVLIFKNIFLNITNTEINKYFL